jgi:uncharacterized protein (TIGR03000 family)
MTTNFGKTVAALAVVTVLAWLSPQQARAQRGYPNWAGDTGFTWDQLERYDPVTNPYGPRKPQPDRPSYPARVVYPSAYPSVAASASYYSGTPTTDNMPSGDYSYGAYAPPAPSNTARIRLIVPADARVWFGNAATEQSGAVRHFESPALKSGKDYTYEVKVRWTENGKEVTRTRQVDVRANSSATVDFTASDARQTKAPKLVSGFPKEVSSWR